jgi:hypothetical protein
MCSSVSSVCVLRYVLILGDEAFVFTLRHTHELRIESCNLLCAHMCVCVELL